MNYETMNFIDLTISNIRDFVSEHREKDMILDVIINTLIEIKEDINVHK